MDLYFPNQEVDHKAMAGYMVEVYNTVEQVDSIPAAEDSVGMVVQKPVEGKQAAEHKGMASAALPNSGESRNYCRTFHLD
jgi:hypothetical protein